MAAVFTVEDGTGLTAANSILSVADADQIMENFDDPAAWSAATDAVKENALRQATRYLNYMYVWDGYKTVTTQGCQWPRYPVYDEDGTLIDSDTIPQRVKEACAYLALQDVNGDTLMPDNQNEGTVKKTKDVIGPITEEREYLYGEEPDKQYTTVEMLIEPFVIGDNGQDESMTVEVERT